MLNDTTAHKDRTIYQKEYNKRPDASFQYKCALLQDKAYIKKLGWETFSDRRKIHKLHSCVNNYT